MKRGAARAGGLILAVLFTLVAGGSYFHHHGALPILASSSAHSRIDAADDGPERCAVCGASHTGARLQDRSDVPDPGGTVVLTGRDSERSMASTVPPSSGSPRSPPSAPNPA